MAEFTFRISPLKDLTSYVEILSSVFIVFELPI